MSYGALYRCEENTGAAYLQIKVLGYGLAYRIHSNWPAPLKKHYSEASYPARSASLSGSRLSIGGSEHVTAVDIR